MHLRDLSGLPDLRWARTRAPNQLLARTGISVAHHQADVFLFDDATDRYLGRLCCFRKCPADKPDCRVPGCGDVSHLKQHEDFTLRTDALAPASSEILQDACPL